jgi:O-Antigen ligase
MVIISMGTTGIRGIIFGGRYDFAFLIVYLIAYHGYPLLQKPLSYYLRIWLYSAGAMLAVSALLKWPLHEDILLYFGYSGNPSVWDFGGAPPIFQGIDGANVRRFQWLLDGPNTMGAFLIIFSGIFAYFTRLYHRWHFVIGCILLGLVGMILYTYSRSALIGIIGAYMIVLVMSLSVLWRLYRGQLIAVFMILALLVGSIAVVFSGRAMAIIGRAGSTSGHSERMITGIHRTLEHPLGQWLGSAGPAYRHVQSLSGEDHLATEELDRYYIPESWYIQQFIEWWFVWGILFILVLFLIFIQLIQIHPILASTFAGVGAMNLFLHTFESSIVSLIAHRHHATK